MSKQFRDHLRETIRAGKEKEAIDAAQAAQQAGDIVAASHHGARAQALRDSWKNADAAKEVEAEMVSQLRQSLGHPDPAVSQTARQALEELGVYSR
jgi:hypothetical protein